MPKVSPILLGQKYTQLIILNFEVAKLQFPEENLASKWAHITKLAEFVKNNFTSIQEQYPLEFVTTIMNQARKNALQKIDLIKESNHV